MISNRSRIVFALAVGSLSAPAAPSLASAQLAHIGPRIGYDFDKKEVFLSGQLILPLAPRLDFYPSVDIYTPARGSMQGFNGDFRMRVPAVAGPDFYVGGGVNLLRRTLPRTDNTTDVGANMLFGVESRTGWVHPFVEGRTTIRNNATFQVIGGLNFTIGGR